MTTDTFMCEEEGTLSHEQGNNTWNCKDQTTKSQVVRQFKTSWQLVNQYIHLVWEGTHTEISLKMQDLTVLIDINFTLHRALLCGCNYTESWQITFVRKLKFIHVVKLVHFYNRDYLNTVYFKVYQNALKQLVSAIVRSQQERQSGFFHCTDMS